ncbi:hypothetical protein [Paraburkholderia sp.]|uniref:hypothetical protein n=1 Tax=Paraburkholderia sp. TaxID=1926495 RepID=UPI002396FA74|nr:hypothetical protein [Paraburkholderia sp.]MDE1183754.1 hypothetical protein [Paraburkholderia sp.]
MSVDAADPYDTTVFIRGASRRNWPPIMDYSFALQVFAVLLSLISLALVPLTLPMRATSLDAIVSIDALPRARWPALLTRAGTVGLLASFVALLGGCYLLLR